MDKYRVQVRSTRADKLITLLNCYGEEYFESNTGEWYLVEEDEAHNITSGIEAANQHANNIQEMYNEEGQQVEVRVIKETILYREI